MVCPLITLHTGKCDRNTDGLSFDHVTTQGNVIGTRMVCPLNTLGTGKCDGNTDGLSFDHVRYREM